MQVQTLLTISLAIAGVLLAGPAAAQTSTCSAASGERQVPLLELYTSEGCDSCPPADRFVTGLRARGYGAERAVVLAYHVDYWDKLGWVDRYAQGRFSERQRLVNNRNGARVIYTPQFMLNGKDYRGTGDFEKRVADVGRAAAKASIRLDIKPAAEQLSVSGAWSADGARSAQGWLALYENRLATDVRAGENRNKRLEHDYVVRDIAGPFPIGSLAHVFKVDASWKRADLGVAGFVQDAKSGETLQALGLGVCPQRVN